DAGFTVGIVLTQVVVWALSGGGYFWPEWVILPLGLVLAIHGLVEAVLQKWPADAPVNRAVAIHGGVVAALFAFVTLIWTVTRPAPFWPGWVLLSLAIPLGIHAAISRSGRFSRMARRVETLETTRAGAVEEQEAELRRI